MSEFKVDSATIEAFKQDEVCVIRGAFTDWVEVLRTGLARNMEEHSADVKIYTGANGAGRFFGDHCNWARISEYRDFIFNSSAASIGRQLMDSQISKPPDE